MPMNTDYNIDLIEGKTQFDELVGEWQSTDWVQEACY
jgi:hypothetical protein